LLSACRFSLLAGINFLSISLTLRSQYSRKGHCNHRENGAMEVNVLLDILLHGALMSKEVSQYHFGLCEELLSQRISSPGNLGLKSTKI
jgi:hypothetical protein